MCEVSCCFFRGEPYNKLLIYHPFYCKMLKEVLENVHLLPKIYVEICSHLNKRNCSVRGNL